MRLISFSFNNATKLFFHCYHNLNQARFFYILFSVTSTKYLLNELNFYQQIIQGKIPPSNKNLKENDIKTVQNSEHQYYDVFNSFQANYEQINKFYTEKLLNQFDKLKSIYSEKYKQLIQIVNEIVKTDKTDEITQNNFNIKFISNAQDEFLNQSKNDKILMMQHQDKFIHYKYICFIHFIPRSLNKMNQKIQKKKQINLQLRNYKIKFSIQE
ncbi:unnamed protein product [Paramecium sonneborni]|uniref:Uncharacterized protein n=1 Tax=Paramecium sonneborni TaxID=65129 RepID=A0A8S1R540_9CILI|nr:unnamed protein product [Paramecium sonneborni]